MVTKRTITIEYSELLNNDKWLINFFLAKGAQQDIKNLNLFKIGDLVVERVEFFDPQKYPDWDFTYLGLENVESNTGFLLNCFPRKGAEIKSRSKIIYGGDLLYGKLRPSLCKATVLNNSFKRGICSTEFFVLKINEQQVGPNYLRLILTSDFVLNQIKSFTAGAALPRIHIDDFLNIKVPLPNKNLLLVYEHEIMTLQSKLSRSRELLSRTRDLYSKIFDAIKSGMETISIDLDENNQLEMNIQGDIPIPRLEL